MVTFLSLPRTACTLGGMIGRQKCLVGHSNVLGADGSSGFCFQELIMDTHLSFHLEGWKNSDFCAFNEQYFPPPDFQITAEYNSISREQRK